MSRSGERKFERNNLHGGQNLLKTQKIYEALEREREQTFPKRNKLNPKILDCFFYSLKQALRKQLENKVLAGRVAPASVVEKYYQTLLKVYEKKVSGNSTNSFKTSLKKY